MAESFPIQAVTEGNEADLVHVLKNYAKSTRKVTDGQGNTILHLALVNDKTDFLKVLLNNVRNMQEKHYSNDLLMTEWVNELNQDGYTALHLAVSKGNLVISRQALVKLLFSFGASNEVKTPMGLDVVHLAAQNDYPQLIAYFDETRLDLESKDLKGLTPLHWAAYMGAYHAALVLCSCRVSRNVQDNEGHTALHLAVVGNNLRIVKLLVIKGCIKNFKDNQGKTPMDHALVNRFTNLIDSLKSNTFLEIMGFKPNITPFATSIWPFVLLLGTLVVCFLLIGVFCATCKQHTDNREVTYAYGATCALVIIFMIFIVKSDPGYLPKDRSCKLTVRLIQDLYNSNKPAEICPDCKIVKIARSRHCHQCHRCVMKFDHHCQWMNNCIGTKNLGFFYTFIVLLFINIVLAITLCISVFVSRKVDNDGDDIPLDASIGASALCLIIEVFMIFPVGYLLYTHTLNFVTGLTTNERMTSAGKASKSNKGCCVNCYHMCCNVNTEDLYHERFTSTALLEVSMQEKD